MTQATQTDEILLILYINGGQQAVPNTCSTLAALLEHLQNKTGGPAEPFAIAINHNFIPKSTYATTRLKSGDHIELVTPMQGG